MEAESLIYRCGKCGHQHRSPKSKENWRCPKCEAAYAKVGLAGYQVVFAGALTPGVSLEEAKRALAEEFGLSDGVIARLFSSSPTVIKHHITRERAEALVARMAEAGLEAGIEAVPGYATTVEPVEPRLALETSRTSPTTPGTAVTPAPRRTDQTVRDVRTGPVYRETRPAPAPASIQQRRRLRPAVVVALVLICLPLAGMLLRWGTVSPCGALKQELHWRFSKEVMAGMSQSRGTLEAAGMMLGSAFGGTMIDNMMEGMPPTRCATGLMRLVFSGDAGLSGLDGASTSASLDGDAIGGGGPSRRRPPEPQTTWLISEKASPMDDTPKVSILGETRDTITTRFGMTYNPVLILRCEDHTLDVFVNARTTLDGFWEKRKASVHEIRLRLDDDTPWTTDFSYSTSGEAVFFAYPKGVYNQLARAERVAVELQPNEMGQQAVVFDLAGMKEHLPALKRACAL